MAAIRVRIHIIWGDAELKSGLFRTLAFALALTTAAPQTGWAASAFDPQLRQMAMRMGMNPEETRALFKQIDGIAALNKVQSNTLRAIAVELGADSGKLSTAELVRRIEAQAKAVATAQETIKALNKTIAKLDPGGARTRAEALMVKAQTAFDAGQLDEAEAAFAELAFLRTSQYADARKVWIEALKSQANVAATRGTDEGSDRADELNTKARSAFLADAKQAKREAWIVSIANADQRYQRGLVFGINGTLARAIDIYIEDALPLVLESDQTTDWAATQNYLGNALWALGARSSAARGQKLLAEATAAYRSALTVYDRTGMSAQWARVQHGLGNALTSQSERNDGDLGLQLLADAVNAYNEALKVRTETEYPSQWARTQNGLGDALTIQGERRGGIPGLKLLAEAETAYRAALRVRTETSMPSRWARTETSLGNAQRVRGEQIGGEFGLALITDSVSAHRAALRVFTETEMPADWAMTQNNLGSSHRAQSERTEGDAGLAIAVEAVSAHRAALRVFTEEHMPADWAMTQTNLGNALRTQGERTGGAAGLGLLADAVTAYRAALTVYTAEHFGPYHEVASRNLARTEALIAERRAALGE